MSVCLLCVAGMFALAGGPCIVAPVAGIGVSHMSHCEAAQQQAHVRAATQRTGRISSQLV